MEFLDWEPFSLTKEEKNFELLNKLKELTAKHFLNSPDYKKLLLRRGINFETLNQISSICELPFIPVRLFKHYQLKSISDSEIYKILLSSGTTSQIPSKIFLDKFTSQFQSKILVKIIQNFLGKKRLPMLIIDNEKTVKNRTSFSARGAGILGLSNFGHSHTFILDEHMNIDFEKLNDFLSKFSNQPKLIFGFTYMIWQHFIRQLDMSNNLINFENSTLFHSGGWKKLEKESISNDKFKEKIKELTKIKDIFNFYGMVEQVGSIFVECEYGHFHAPSYSDIIIRDPHNFNILGKNVPGIVQVLSALPHSYPGHSLLTEDLGTILGEDDCKCGRLGKYFNIHGRIINSEKRGCSDTFYNEN